MNKEKRVRKNEEFTKIIQQHHRNNSQRFTIYYAGKQLDHARVGISVSKKLGNAVKRNKIKRQLRMMIGGSYDFSNAPYDLIIIVRPAYLDYSYSDNLISLQDQIKRIL